MEGELWIARGRFDEVSATVRRVRADPQAWRYVRFMAFDLPANPRPFAERVVRMRALIAGADNPQLAMIPQRRFDGFAMTYRVFALLALFLPMLLLAHWGDGSLPAYSMIVSIASSLSRAKLCDFQ